LIRIVKINGPRKAPKRSLRTAIVSPWSFATA